MDNVKDNVTPGEIARLWAEIPPDYQEKLSQILRLLLEAEAAGKDTSKLLDEAMTRINK